MQSSTLNLDKPRPPKYIRAQTRTHRTDREPTDGSSGSWTFLATNLVDLNTKPYITPFIIISPLYFALAKYIITPVYTEEVEVGYAQLQEIRQKVM